MLLFWTYGSALIVTLVFIGVILFGITFAKVNVYCPECPLGGTIGHPGGQQKRFLPFGHGRDLVAFNGTGL